MKLILQSVLRRNPHLPFQVWWITMALTSMVGMLRFSNQGNMRDFWITFSLLILCMPLILRYNPNTRRTVNRTLYIVSCLVLVICNLAFLVSNW